jgi:hypothetical protein
VLFSFVENAFAVTDTTILENPHRYSHTTEVLPLSIDPSCALITILIHTGFIDNPQTINDFSSLFSTKLPCSGSLEVYHQMHTSLPDPTFREEAHINIWPKRSCTALTDFYLGRQQCYNHACGLLKWPVLSASANMSIDSLTHHCISGCFLVLVKWPQVKGPVCHEQLVCFCQQKSLYLFKTTNISNQL